MLSFSYLNILSYPRTYERFGFNYFLNFRERSIICLRKHSYKYSIGYTGVSFRIDIFSAGNSFFIKIRYFLWNGLKYLLSKYQIKHLYMKLCSLACDLLLLKFILLFLLVSIKILHNIVNLRVKWIYVLITYYENCLEETKSQIFSQIFISFLKLLSITIRGLIYTRDNKLFSFDLLLQKVNFQ